MLIIMHNMPLFSPGRVIVKKICKKPMPLPSNGMK